METQLRPVPTRDTLQQRRSDAVHLDRTNEGAWIVVRYPNGESVTVTGAERLWRLIALANDALPEDDARKITRADAHLLHALVASIEVQDADFSRLLPHVDALCQKVGALLGNR